MRKGGDVCSPNYRSKEKMVVRKPLVGKKHVAKEGVFYTKRLVAALQWCSSLKTALLVGR